MPFIVAAALKGIAALAMFIGTTLLAIVEFLAARVSFKVALILIYIGLLAASAALVTVALDAALSAITPTIPNNVLYLFADFIPSNYKMLLGILIGFEVAIKIFRWTQHILYTKLQVG